jgi:hypothetical protein
MAKEEQEGLDKNKHVRPREWARGQKTEQFHFAWSFHPVRLLYTYSSVPNKHVF